MRQLPRLSCVGLCILVLACKGGGADGGEAGGTGGDNSAVDGGSGGAGGNGGVGGNATTDCDPGSTRDCYTGPPGTENVGACMTGFETCNTEGTGWSGCVGEVLPAAEVVTPPGETPADEDCDGMTDEAES